MKILEIFNLLWKNKEVVKKVANTLIIVIDSFDGQKDWELKDSPDKQ